MTPNDVAHIVRNLEAAGAAFEKCQHERCACGQAREDCRTRWKIFKLALIEAHKKVEDYKEQYHANHGDTVFPEP